MRRSVWLAAGFGLGLYTADRLRRVVTRAVPEQLTDRVRSAVTDAVAAGKDEMRASERRLRETFAAPERGRGTAREGRGAER